IIRLKDFQRLSDISEIYGREQISVRAGKPFERSNTTVMKIYKVFHVIFYRIRAVIKISYKSSPQCIVYQGMFADLAQLQVKNLFIHQGWIIIKGHIDQTGTPCHYRCSGTCLKIFTVFKSRLIQMRMAVNNTREYISSFGVDNFFCFCLSPFSKKSSILAILNGDIRFVDPVRSYELSISYQQIIHKTFLLSSFQILVQFALN